MTKGTKHVNVYKLERQVYISCVVSFGVLGGGTSNLDLAPSFLTGTRIWSESRQHASGSAQSILRV